MDRVRGLLASVRDDFLKGQNLDAYILIIFGLLFSFLEIIGIVSLDILGPIILIALTILVMGDLVSRKQNKEFQQTLLAAVTDSAGPLKRFARADDRMSERIAVANSLSLLGLSVNKECVIVSIPNRSDANKWRALAGIDNKP